MQLRWAVSSRPIASALLFSSVFFVCRLGFVCVHCACDVGIGRLPTEVVGFCLQFTVATAHHPWTCEFCSRFCSWKIAFASTSFLSAHGGCCYTNIATLDVVV